MNDEQRVAMGDRLMGEFGLNRETVARMLDAARPDALVCIVVGDGENLVVEVPLNGTRQSRTIQTRFVMHNAVMT